MSDVNPPHREWRFYVNDMIGFVEKVLSYTADMNQQAFVASGITYDAVLRNPANMATCPLTISIYQKAGDETYTCLAFRRPRLLGKSADVEKAITRLLGGIVEEALE